MHAAQSSAASSPVSYANCSRPTDAPSRQQVWDLRLWVAAAQVRRAQMARHDGGRRSAWAQTWRSRRKWEEERRREATAEAVAGRRRAAEEEAARRLAAEEAAGRRRAAVLEARRVRKAEARAARGRESEAAAAAEVSAVVQLSCAAAIAAAAERAAVDRAAVKRAAAGRARVVAAIAALERRDAVERCGALAALAAVFGARRVLRNAGCDFELGRSSPEAVAGCATAPGPCCRAGGRRLPHGRGRSGPEAATRAQAC